MSWSGAFTNETFTGPGTYQAKTGVRCFIDMRTTPGPVQIDAPLSPEDNSSFIVSWDNPTAELLTLTGANPFESPLSIETEFVSSPSTTMIRGSVAFSYVSGKWHLFDWSLFGFHMRVSFALSWVGRNTNGLCTLHDSIKTIEVERTAKGFYTIRLEAGTLLPNTLLLKAPSAVGLPAETSPELRPEDVGMATPDIILINAGTRNKNGQFSDDDLTQDASNFMALIGQRFP